MTTDAPKPAIEIQYLRHRDVSRRTTLSRPEIERRMKAGTFPRPIQLGHRTRVWVESEIAEWMAAQAAARDRREVEAPAATAGGAR